MGNGEYEQRNAYRGNPPRALVRLSLISPDGEAHDLDFLADTGNPCSLIVSVASFRQLCWRQSAATESNFGTLDGGWFRVVIP
jgi:hypothetical protein